ncbi:MAG: sulfatase-like hydrolase/transferase, partial [Acidimicrobiales bacterium]
LGRILTFLEDLGELDDTIVMVVSDNGASAEGGPDGSINDVRLVNLDPADDMELRRRIDEIGGPTSHNNYPWGWTMAGNTPFKRWKREVHQGGVAAPCIVRWGRKASSAGGLRHQFTHAVDVLPTVLELIGVEAPEVIDHVPQRAIDGTSFAYLLEPGGAEEDERHETQYFEMFGSRAIYHRGWKAVTYHPVGPVYDDGLDPNAPFDDDKWELYDLRTDLAEVTDLSGTRPDLVAALVELWWREAERNQVLPLDNRVLWALANPKPDARAERKTARLFAGGAQVPEVAAPDVRGRSHTVSVEVDVPAGLVAEGVLLALGSALGGWSFHVLSGRIRYVHNLYGKVRCTVESAESLGPGRHHLSADVEMDDPSHEAAGHGSADLGAIVVLRCDGRQVSSGRVDRFTRSGFNGVGAGLVCGAEWGPAIGTGYAAPFPFNGTILRAEVETRGPKRRDPLSELARVLSEQ